MAYPCLHSLSESQIQTKKMAWSIFMLLKNIYTRTIFQKKSKCHVDKKYSNIVAM